MRDPQKKKFQFLRLLPLLPFLIILSAAAVFVLSGHSITVQDILHYTPANPLAAALILILLCALKSLTVFFPIVALLVAGGMLFPAPAALFINTLGVAVCISTPYWLGRLTSGDLVERIFSRYPKLKQLEQFQRQNHIFFSYIVRVIGILPCDIVSLYLGAVPIPYPSYLLGGLLGFLPCILTSTLMGMNITDPTSPEFILSTLLQLFLSAVSSAAYWFWKKKRR